MAAPQPADESDLAHRRQRNKRILIIIGSVVGVFLILGIIGAIFGEDEGDPNTKTASPSTESTSESKPSPTRSSTADPTAAKAALVAKAEKIVADELPDIPLWKGTTFTGAYESKTKVCPDRTFKNGTNAGYVVVTFPKGSTGEPQERYLCEARA